MKSARRIRFETRQAVILPARAARHAQANDRRKKQAEWRETVARSNFSKKAR